jgi:hypothetical protein
MAKKQVLNFKPAPRPEQISDKREEQTEDRAALRVAAQLRTLKSIAGVRVRCATQQNEVCDVRFGSKADIALPHSITSSARTRNDSGIFRPIAFAVFRFTTNSNLTGICTGRSVGFAPRRIWSM